MQPNKLFLCVVALAVGIVADTAVHAQPAVEAWVQRYNGPTESDDHARNIAVDSSGNVIVAGFSDWGGGSDWLIIKYSGAGTPLWTNRYAGPGNDSDYGLSMALDTIGNVFVTGVSYDGYLTIKYSSAGVPLWTNRYRASQTLRDIPAATAVDGSGNVFVTGSSMFHSSTFDSWVYDWATVAYSGAGVPLWTNRYDGPAHEDDAARAIAVDGNGNVFVTGNSRVANQYPNFSDYVTIMYSNAGVPRWTNNYNYGEANAMDLPTAIAVDAGGNVIVTGQSDRGGFNYDYATIKYSNAGLLLWVNRYNGPGNRHDWAAAVAVDSSGNVFVTGWSDGGGYDYDYATIKYSGAGVPLWTNRYNGPANYEDEAYTVAVDGSGNAFVTGWSDGFVTIKYSGAGVPLWTNRYGSGDCGSGETVTSAVDGNGDVVVTTSSPGNGGLYSSDFATIKYSGAGVPLWTNRYTASGNGVDIANAVAVDGNGNVFVTGYSVGTQGYYNYDYTTVAYSSAGVPLWANRYGGSDKDQATGIATDGNGNVFVTGWSVPLYSGFYADYATIKYSSAGVPLWTNRYSWADDRASAMAVDSNGNVFVTGYSGQTTNRTDPPWLENTDYATVAYSSAGVPLWTNRYRGSAGPVHAATAIAVDHSGNVFVTGYASDLWALTAWATIAYSGAGVPLWTNRYTGPGSNYRANAIAVDGSGNVFVTGFSGSACATIKYSNGGVPLWTNYSGSASAIAVDGNGNVFVTGGTATIKYSGSGVSLWTNYSGSTSAVAVDGSGNVFVTGSSVGSGSSADYATIKYSNSGVPLWTNRYNGLGNGSDNAYALAVDRNGDVVVTGSSVGNRTGADYVTIKYSSAGPLLTIARTTTNALAVSWPSPAADFTLQQNTNVTTTNWAAVSTIPADDGTNKSVIVGPPEGNRFYRLFHL